MINEEHIILLAERAVDGALSESEQRELDAWMDADPLNRKAFEEMCAVFRLAGDGMNQIDPQTDLEWAKVEAELEAVERPLLPPARRRPSWAIAAAVVLLATIGFFALRGQFGDEKSQGMVFAAQNGLEKQIRLEDGSEVVLQPGSKITLSEEFGKEERRLRLEGSAFFKVHRDIEHPFVVEAGVTETRVLGTQFHVRSLPEDQAIKVEVTEGKVGFAHPVSGEEALLTANMEARFSAAEGKITVVAANPDRKKAADETAIVVRNQPLGEFIGELEEAFLVDLEFPEEMLEKRLTATFQKGNQDLMLETLEITLGGNFEEKDAIYRFVPGN
jgi:transmembrane sensor